MASTGPQVVVQVPAKFRGGCVRFRVPAGTVPVKFASERNEPPLLAAM